jgi:hypothetical protein
MKYYHGITEICEIRYLAVAMKNGTSNIKNKAASNRIGINFISTLSIKAGSINIKIAEVEIAYQRNQMRLLASGMQCQLLIKPPCQYIKARPYIKNKGNNII